MRISLATILRLTAALIAFTASYRPQITAAQCVDNNEPPVAAQTVALAPSIPAASAPCYAGYYAPYAVLAVAAYRPILPILGNPNEPGLDSTIGQAAQSVSYKDGSYQVSADIKYAIIEDDFADPDTTKQARDLMKSWRYRFGHEGYLGCYDPNDSECKKALTARWWAVYHAKSLAFQVWSRSIPHTPRSFCPEISIAFRGTNIRSPGDVISDLRQLVGTITDDEYDQLGRNMGAIIRKISALPCYVPSFTQITSVGHSLGGGLAQFAALAVPPSAPARIAKVFAFNTSPVTAAMAVAKGLRVANANGLSVDRLHQEGEILSTYVGWDQQYPPSSSACNPLVRTVDFDAFQPPPPTDRFGRLIHWALPRAYNALPLHAMAPFAAKLVQWSYDEEGGLLPSAVPKINYPCGTNYRSPPVQRAQSHPIVTGAISRQAVTSSDRVVSGSEVAEASWQQASHWGAQDPSTSDFVSKRIRKLTAVPAERRTRKAQNLAPYS
jgi:hypothetical protein